MFQRGIPVVVAAVTVCAASVAAACNADHPPASPAPPNACPTTIDLAIAAPCTEGLSCPFEVACGASTQQVTCACTQGTLDCAADSTNAALSVGEDAASICISLAPPAKCPSNMPANLSPCATTGLLCTYPGCDEGGATETCECVAADRDGGGFVFSCPVSSSPCETSDSGAGEAGGANDAAFDGHPPDANAPDTSTANDASDDGG